MTLIYFILILSFIIFFHELGHFLTAKMFNVYVHEFSIGMGPTLFKKKIKETEYLIKLFPIGGYVRISGEDGTIEEHVPKEKSFASKKWYQRFLILIAGSAFNFLAAILIIFTLALIYGTVSIKPYIGGTMKGYPAYNQGLNRGDLVLSINGDKVSSYDEMSIKLFEIGNKKTTFKIRKEDGSIILVTMKPILEDELYVYGIRPPRDIEYGFIKSINYTIYKFNALMKTMFITTSGLVTGSIDFDQFTGPIGVYNMVGDKVQTGIGDIAYFIAYLSLNIGFVNLLPFPALDGGRLIFLIIEKITRKKVKPEIEGLIHLLGFMLLISLMLLVTFNDIFRLGGS